MKTFGLPMFWARHAAVGSGPHNAAYILLHIPPNTSISSSLSGSPSSIPQLFLLFSLFPSLLLGMAPAPTNGADPTLAGGGGGEGEKQKLLDREIRDMISMLTNRLSDLHKQSRPAEGGSCQGDGDADDDDEHGVRIITLAGTNTGASMRGSQLQDDKQVRGCSEGENEEAAAGVGTYVNSNFQSINNSIMMGGSYSTNDPGVHMDVSQDFLEQQRDANGLDLATAPKAKAKSEQQSAAATLEEAARS